MQQASSFWLLAVSFWHYTLNSKLQTIMNTNDVCKFPSIEGRGEMSLGCDDGRFISPKENCQAVYGVGLPILPFPNSPPAPRRNARASTTALLRVPITYCMC